ncbi:hypothetical protein C8Q79DRAFT_478291 [Trametes meyenii]|nr:hypothetical protein C8Q79DRAFT_478291 [Trametes meyenii]
MLRWRIWRRPTGEIATCPIRSPPRCRSGVDHRVDLSPAPLALFRSEPPTPRPRSSFASERACLSVAVLTLFSKKSSPSCMHRTRPAAKTCNDHRCAHAAHRACINYPYKALFSPSTITPLARLDWSSWPARRPEDSKEDEGKCIQPICPGPGHACIDSVASICTKHIVDIVVRRRRPRQVSPSSQLYGLYMSPGRSTPFLRMHIASQICHAVFHLIMVTSRSACPCRPPQKCLICRPRVCRI